MKEWDDINFELNTKNEILDKQKQIIGTLQDEKEH